MKYLLRHECGHRYEHQIVGPNTRGQREDRAAYLERQPCPDCATTARAEQRQQQNQEAAEHAASAGWPQLTGTERQVAWATTIRHQTLAALFDRLRGGLSEDQYDRVLPLITGVARRQTSAAWWIDNRDQVQRALGTAMTDEERSTLTTIDQETA